MGTRYPQNYSQAFACYKKAAELGNEKGQVLLGNCYYDGLGVAKNGKKAFEWWFKAAKQGDVAAQYNLGLAYHKAIGTNLNYEKAIEWYLKAAEQGYDQAQSRLGYFYGSGIGVEKNQQKSVEWYSKAAAQGDVYALFNLGVFYQQGNGVEQDWNKSVECYRKAADSGFALAQYNMGVCYYNGQGVNCDCKKAKEWMKCASNQGFEEAKVALDTWNWTEEFMQSKFEPVASNISQVEVVHRHDGLLTYAKQQPSEAEFLNAIDCFYQSGFSEYEDSSIDLAVKTYPHSFPLKMAKVKRLFSQNADSAMSYLESIQDEVSDDNRIDFIKYKITALCLSNRVAEAEEYVTSLINDAPDNHLLFRAVALGFFHAKMHQLALFYYKKMLVSGMFENEPELYLDMATCYFWGEKDYVKAEESLLKYLEKKPKNQNTWLRLIDVYSIPSCSQPEKKLNAIEHYLALNPNCYDVMLQEADLLIDFNRFEEAKKIIEQCLSIEPTNVSASIRKSLILEKQAFLNKGNKLGIAVE